MSPTPAEERKAALRKSNLRFAMLPVGIALVFALSYVLKQTYLG